VRSMHTFPQSAKLSTAVNVEAFFERDHGGCLFGKCHLGRV
jgi:hypothetical protein